MSGASPDMLATRDVEAMTLSRRSLFGGLMALATPAIIRTPGLLMPIQSLRPTRSFISDAAVVFYVGEDVYQQTSDGAWYYWQTERLWHEADLRYENWRPTSDPRLA